MASLSHNLQDTDLVKIRGVEMHVKDAMDYGYIRKTDNGYIDSVPNSKPQPTARQSHEESLDHQAESILSNIPKTMGDAQATAAMIAYSKGKGVSTAAIQEMASKNGMEPIQAKAQFQHVQAAFTEQAAGRMSEYGINPEHALEWAWKEEPRKMQSAIQTQYYERSTKGFDKVAMSYIENLDTIDLQMIFETNFGRGYSVEQGAKGKILINAPDGMQSEWKAFVKSGVMPFGKR
jgi:hypothetical protein